MAHYEAVAEAVRLASQEMGTFREAMKVRLDDFDLPHSKPQTAELGPSTEQEKKAAGQAQS